MSRREQHVRIVRIQTGKTMDADDVVAVEEPLEIRIVFGPAGNRKSRSLSVTMRTPGHDLELAAGFLVSEGIVSQPGQIQASRFTGPIPVWCRTCQYN